MSGPKKSLLGCSSSSLRKKARPSFTNSFLLSRPSLLMSMALKEATAACANITTIILQLVKTLIGCITNLSTCSFVQLFFRSRIWILKYFLSILSRFLRENIWKLRRLRFFGCGNNYFWYCTSTDLCALAHLFGQSQAFEVEFVFLDRNLAAPVVVNSL